MDKGTQNMIKPQAWYRFATILLLGLFSATAQAGSYTQGLLWKIERSGQAPSYVFGTIHSEDPRVMNLAKPVQSAFDSAKIFVMEAVIDADAMQSMSRAMLFNDGRALKDVVSASTYGKTVTALTDYGLPEAAVQLMQPWALSITLSTPKPKTGLVLDLSLMQQATAQGKQTAGLESVDEQIGIFAKLPMREQVIMLEDTLQHFGKLEQVLASMHNAYLARDLGKLERISAEQMALGNRALGEKLMRQLLDERNTRMVSRMEPYLKKGQAFIAIGALHLPGKAGLLNLLAQKGYRISAVY